MGFFGVLESTGVIDNKLDRCSDCVCCEFSSDLSSACGVKGGDGLDKAEPRVKERDWSQSSVVTDNWTGLCLSSIV